MPKEYHREVLALIPVHDGSNRCVTDLKGYCGRTVAGKLLITRAAMASHHVTRTNVSTDGNRILPFILHEPILEVDYADSLPPLE